MLTKDQRDRIETLLRREREEVVESLQAFDRDSSQSLEEEAGELSSYRFHMADIATETMEREKSYLLASKEGERLYRIDEALRRLYRDPETFGTCERCGETISFERLEVMPEAARCATCQAEIEQDGGGD